MHLSLNLAKNILGAFFGEALRLNLFINLT